MDHEVVQFRRNLAPENQFAPTFFGGNRRPSDIALSSDGILWATDSQQGEIRKYVAGTLATWVDYPLPSANSAPNGIILAEGTIEQIFVSASGSGSLFRLVERGSARSSLGELNRPDGATPTGITTDGQGNIWVTDVSRNVITRWQSPYFYSRWLPLVYV